MYRVLVGTLEGKRPLGRHRHRWEDNIKVDVQGNTRVWGSVLDKSREIRWMGNAARMGERRDVYRVLVRKPGRKKPLGKLRRRWEDNINVDVQGNTREYTMGTGSLFRG